MAGDLGIRPGLELAIKKRVEDAGGVCWSWGVDGNKNVDHGERRREAERMLKDANLVVCRHREGWEFWQVSTGSFAVVAKVKFGKLMSFFEE